MNKISFMEISSGEYVGVCSIEITSIPDISIISSRYQDYTDIEKEYMNNFSSLASEVFQNYKYIISKFQCRDIYGAVMGNRTSE